MMNRSASLLTALTIVFIVSLTGCSDSQPKSITEGVDQSAIEAYKEKEKQIELEAMNDMELGE